MSEAIQNQIDVLEDEIKVWNKFSDAVSKLSDKEIIEEAAENYRMVWTSNKIDYYLDYSTFDLITQIVTKNAKIITNVKFNIPHYNVIKGIAGCQKYIATQIKNIENAIDLHKKNLKPNK